MTVDTTAAFWEFVAVAAMRALTVFLAFAAFFSLRRTDPTVLKARIYMNHRKVLSGLRFLGIAMAIFLLQVVIELAYVAWLDGPLPLEITGLIFLVGVAFLIKGFSDFHALSKAKAPSGALPMTASNTAGQESWQRQ